MLQRNSAVAQGLRAHFTNVHPLIFHRSMERATTYGELFDVLDTIQEFPLVWNGDIGRWENTDLLQSHFLRKESLAMLPGISPDKKSSEIIGEITGANIVQTLHRRKCYYKSQFKLASQHVQSLRQLLQRELKMKKLWRFAAVSLGIVVLATYSTLCTLKLSTPSTSLKMIPVSGRAMTTTPPQVSSSVFIQNGDEGFGGTVISSGKTYAAILTCAHAFKGIIGGKVVVFLMDNSHCTGVLTAIDPTRDLAIVKIRSDKVLGQSYITRPLPSASLTAIAFPKGRGPLYDEVTYYGSSDGKWVFNFPAMLTGGGVSGCGVFQGDVQCGVVSMQQPSYCGNTVYTSVVPVDEMVAFLDQNKVALEGCGAWDKQPPMTTSTTQVNWHAYSNVPLPEDRTIQDLKANVSLALRRLDKLQERDVQASKSLEKIKAPIPVKQETPRQSINMDRHIKPATPVIPPSSAGPKPRQPINIDQSEGRPRY